MCCACAAPALLLQLRLRSERFASGCLTLDRALGGGYPKGRIVEIFGPEASGKTTLALHAIAEVQKAGGYACFVDAEHAFDASYAKVCGSRCGSRGARVVTSALQSLLYAHNPSMASFRWGAWKTPQPCAGLVVAPEHHRPATTLGVACLVLPLLRAR